MVECREILFLARNHFTLNSFEDFNNLYLPLNAIHYKFALS